MSRKRARSIVLTSLPLRSLSLMPQVSGNLYHCQKLSSHCNTSSLRITTERSLYYPNLPYSISDFDVSEELPN
jgi:hypothetical protein